jgi:hypothetical protein
VAKASVMLMESERNNEKFILSAENKHHKEIMGLIAQHIGVKRPTLESKPWMLSLFWRWEWLVSKLLQRKPLLTRELANTTQATMLFSGNKMLEIPGFSYTPIEKTIEEMVNSCKNIIPE